MPVPPNFQPTSFETAFEAIFERAYDLLVARQRKYGPENIRRQGLYGVITRIKDDKIARIERSLNGRIIHGKIELDAQTEHADESFEDSLLDVMNYAAIALALHYNWWGLPFETDPAVEEKIPPPQPPTLVHCPICIEPIAVDWPHDCGGVVLIIPGPKV